MSARPADAVRDRLTPAAAWDGQSNGALQPAPARAVAPDAQAFAVGRGAASLARGESAPPRRTWWRRVMRTARDAAVGLALISMIPLWNVARHGDAASVAPVDIVQRVSGVERLRPFMLPRDGTLTPAEAGRAFRSLEMPGGRPGFPMTRIEAPVRRRWKSLRLDRGEFARLPMSSGPTPHPSKLIPAVAPGVSAAELERLRTVAESPLWAVVDPLVRAREVDLVGERFTLPFSKEASPLLMPAVKVLATRNVATAGMWRTAYYVALGDYARAEHAARVVMSYGFLLVDNGSTGIDGLVGAMLVEVGHRGLHEVQALQGGVAVGRVPPVTPRAPPLTRPYTPPLPPRETSAMLLAMVRDDTRPRTLRLAALQQLSLGTCGSVRGVLFGHAAQTRAAFREAQATLARFPSEAALVELLRQAPNRGVPWESLSEPPGLLMGAARVAAAVTGNPRFESCPQLLLANQ